MLTQNSEVESSVLRATLKNARGILHVNQIDFKS